MNLKSISQLFLICMIGTTCFAQSKKTILKNKIKSVTENVTLKKNGKEITYKESYILYNTDGKVLEETCCNMDGVIIKKEIFKYDGEKNKAEEIIYQKKEAALGPKMEILNNRTTFKYNGYKDKIEEVEYDSNNKPVTKTVYAYNNQGEKSSETCYGADGKLNKKINYTYNFKSLKTKRECFLADNTLESVKNYAYEFY